MVVRMFNCLCLWLIWVGPFIDISLARLVGRLIALSSESVNHRVLTEQQQHPLHFLSLSWILSIQDGFSR